MSDAVKALAARFGEHQKRFFAAGGKAKAIKYPEAWQVEAVALRSELGMPIADLANALGVGHSALKRWCERHLVGKSAPRSKPRFVPVEVVGSTQRAAAAARVTLREISVAIDAGADDAFVAGVIAALAKTQRSEPC